MRGKVSGRQQARHSSRRHDGGFSNELHWGPAACVTAAFGQEPSLGATEGQSEGCPCVERAVSSRLQRTSRRAGSPWSLALAPQVSSRPAAQADPKGTWGSNSHTPLISSSPSESPVNITRSPLPQGSGATGPVWDGRWDARGTAGCRLASTAWLRGHQRPHATFSLGPCGPEAAMALKWLNIRAKGQVPEAVSMSGPQA